MLKSYPSERDLKTYQEPKFKNNEWTKQSCQTENVKE